MAAQDGQALTRLTGAAPFEIERVRLTDQDVAIEGHFEVPPLARLTAEDQTFVAAFVRCHGSIKQMEKYFGVSYPTIKNRLNRIGESLPFVEIDRDTTPPAPSPAVRDTLGDLEQGSITVAEAVERLKASRKA